jgi:hypothetical protein
VGWDGGGGCSHKDLYSYRIKNLHAVLPQQDFIQRITVYTDGIFTEKGIPRSRQTFTCVLADDI